MDPTNPTMTNDTSNPFSAGAEYYDLLHADKDYEGEVDFIERNFLGQGCPYILDYGCGTGRHIDILHKKCFGVAGYEPCREMAQQTIDRGRAVYTNIKDIEDNFDTILCLYHTFNYLLTPKEIHEFFANCKKLLKSDGSIVINFIYGVGVLTQGIKKNTTLIGEDIDKTVIRQGTHALLSGANQIFTEYTYSVIGSRLPTAKETHILRYTFLPEMQEWALAHDLQVKQFGKWPKGTHLTESTYDAYAVLTHV